jgi:hypothetical protein
MVTGLRTVITRQQVLCTEHKGVVLDGVPTPVLVRFNSRAMAQG